MSYKSDLQQNNTDLQAILADVNALPDAGSGGGGVETCTIIFDKDLPQLFAYTSYVNGEFIAACEETHGGSISVFENVVCGSIIFVNGPFLSRSASDGTIISRTWARLYYQAPTTPGVTATVSLMFD